MSDHTVVEGNGRVGQRKGSSQRRLTERLTRSLSWTRRGMSVALIVGLVGMATGVTSLYITWRSKSEEAALRLTAYPTASPADITPQGLGVRVELVNESLRPVVLRSAGLLLDGEPVSVASGTRTHVVSIS